MLQEFGARTIEEIAMPDDKTTKQIVPNMSEFEIDDVVSILMGSTPDSEIQRQELVSR